MFHWYFVEFILDESPIQPMSLDICGNGVIEVGEECDCGPENGVGCLGNTFCDPTTCKLKVDQKCDPFNSRCCSKNGTVFPAGTVCKPPTDACEIPQICNGLDGYIFI
jgi:hypothetical protein